MKITAGSTVLRGSRLFCLARPRSRASATTERLLHITKRETGGATPMQIHVELKVVLEIDDANIKECEAEGMSLKDIAVQTIKDLLSDDKEVAEWDVREAQGWLRAS